MIRITIQHPARASEEMVIRTPTEISVGRSVTCNCCLDFDPLVSRMHAVFLITPPSIRVKDLNSTNGLVINGETFSTFSNHPITDPLELRDGDEVKIGHTSFSFKVYHDSPPSGTRGTAGHPTPGQAPFAVAPGTGAVKTDPADTAALLPSAVPVIPGYRLLKQSWTTSGGDLYQAIAEADNSIVTIKVVTPQKPISSQLVDNFYGDMAVACQLEHPNLVKMLGAGVIGSHSLYVIMEYVPGHDLGHILAGLPGQKLIVPSAYNLMLQVSSAVCHLHSQGSVHTDLKPSSILIRDEQGRLRVKLLEQAFTRFLDETGIVPRATVLDDDDRIDYIPPEELAGLYEPKPTFDVFSLAAMFYSMLAGRSPYAFVPGVSKREVVAQGLITPVEEAVPDLPEPLVVIIERALSVDPDGRYQTACELQEALESAWI